jgi:sec-independent protein translocase protein TatB
MFDIGWSELLVIAVVAIVVVGPKELPRLMRTFGHYMGKVRRMASDFQRQFEEAVRDSELDEVRKAMHEVRATASSATADIDKPLMTKTYMETPASTPAAPPPDATKTAAKTPPKPRAKRAPAKAKTAAPKTAAPRDAAAKSAAAPKSTAHETAAAKRAAAPKSTAHKTAAAKSAAPKSAPKPRKPRKSKEPAS